MHIDWLLTSIKYQIKLTAVITLCGFTEIANNHIRPK